MWRGQPVNLMPMSSCIKNLRASPDSRVPFVVRSIFNAVDAMPEGGVIVIRSWDDGDHVFVTV